MVTRHRSPLVRENVHFVRSLSDHGLNGNAHAIMQCDTAHTGVEVGNLRLFVHAGTNTMSDVAAYHAEALTLDKGLYGNTDGVNIVSCVGLFDSLVKGGFRHSQKAVSRFANLTYRIRTGRIPDHTVILDTEVNAHDISFLEDVLLGRKAVDNSFIYRAADGKGITAIPQKGRLDVILFTHGAGEIFKLHGRDTRTNLVSDCVEDIGRNTVSFPEIGDLAGVLDKNTLKLFHGYLFSG